MGDEWSDFEMAGDDMINVLDDRKGFDVLAQTLEYLKDINFSCDGDFNLQRKVDACKEKTDEANSGIADEEEIERLQKELDQELKREFKLKEELRKKPSMYASVTKVIPNIDEPLKTSGYMVDRDKRVIEMFEFDADKMTPYETCNGIWEVINKR